MAELTPKQLTYRWADIKKQIKQRQLLAYIVGIPAEKWDTYMGSTLPDKTEINRIYNAIENDRIKKTARIKDGLSKIVGYRESKEFAKRSGVSDSHIRNIIEGKVLKASYDIINRLELFLSTALPDFEPSIENPLTLKSYSKEFTQGIADSIHDITKNLGYYSFQLINSIHRPQEMRYSNLFSAIDRAIDDLNEIKLNVGYFWKTYIELNNKDK